MLQLNPFLTSGDEPSKGGGRFIEDPRAVENIVFQTRGAALSDFEQRFADCLMSAYGESCVTLEDLVSSLNRQQCADATGGRWSAESLTSQLTQSADLFADIGDTQ